MPKRKPTFRGSVKRTARQAYWISRQLSLLRHERITLEELLERFYWYTVDICRADSRAKPGPTRAQLLSDILCQLDHSQWWDYPLLRAIRDMLNDQNWDKAANEIRKGLPYDAI